MISSTGMAREDRSERLDVVPVRFRVVVARWPKYPRRAREKMAVQVPASLWAHEERR